MPIKLVIQKVDEDAGLVEKVFEDPDLITIGRDSSSDLRLYDEDKMVSRDHAELRREGGEYSLLDLGSRNLTYLGGEAIEPNKLFPLADGDVFRIANFEVKFSIYEEAPEDFDRTVWLDFENPLLEATSALVESISVIASRYEALPPGRKESALAEAIENAVPSIQDDPFATRLLASLQQEVPPVEARLSGLPPVPAVATSRSGDDRSEQFAADVPLGPQTSAPAIGELSRFSRKELEAGLEMLLKRASELASVADQFRYEFTGATVFPRSEKFSWENVDTWMRDSLIHEIALLDGYKAAALEGGRHLLDEVDPDVATEKLKRESGLYRLLPFLTYGQVIRDLSETVRRMRKDVEVLEVRVFRPAFLKAYLARQTSSHRDQDDLGDF